MNDSILLRILRRTQESPHILSVRQLTLLLILFREKRTLDMGYLRGLAGFTSPVISRGIELLSICKYVRCVPNEDNRRRRDVSLTAEGYAFVKKVLKT